MKQVAEPVTSPILDQYALPLCVDLDGTLVNTDMLLETLLLAIRRGTTILKIPFWLYSGKASLKQRIADHVEFDPALLPYNLPLLNYLMAQRALNRKIFLATASNRRIADRIASYLGCFDDVIASDRQRNLRGADKTKILVERFGVRGFSYAGNDRTDIPVWRSAGTAVIVNASPRVARAAEAVTIIEHRIEPAAGGWRSVLKALRPHQWLKNLLVFVPIITANAYFESAACWAAAITFFAFCATASGIYVLNDLFDLAADRRHPRKRLRPFASGMLPLITGFWLVAGLLVLGGVLAALTDAVFVLAAYAVCSICYCFYLKNQPLVDIFILAALYTLRLFGGGEAAGHRVSFWLLGFSSFLFFSLAVIKRVGELRSLQQSNFSKTRGYMNTDATILQTMGVASSFVSSMVLALYVQSDVVLREYSRPEILWAIVPLMLFWQCRLWLSTARGYMHDDPLVYSAKDWVSWVVGACMIGIVMIANVRF